MVLLKGTGVSGGIAAGRLRFFTRPDKDVPRYTAEDGDKEWGRFDSARREAVRQIHELAEETRRTADGPSGEDAAQILAAHEIMAMDPEYEEKVGERIRKEHMNAEAAVMDAAGEAASGIAASDDDYMRARASDVEDVARRIVAAMEPAGWPEAEHSGGLAARPDSSESAAGQTAFANQETSSDPDSPVILAADDLAPSETLRLNRTKILGFITAGGSVSGHTAILARTMGIPAIIGTGSQLKPEYEGQEILMDGDTGEIAVAPDGETRARFRAKEEKQRQEAEKLAALKGEKAETKDGRSVRLCCNISFPSDISAVLDSGADGIGLFRSECLFLGREEAPSEEEQFEAYRQVLSAMEGRHVVIRTLDAGSDKQADYLGLAAEVNPALGNRGIRFSLSRPELFAVQLRALARASAYGSLGIMFPMVTSVWEVAEAKRLWRQVQEELDSEGIPFDGQVPVGIMIETPAAALISEQLAEEADFFSIGTNDLIQYTLAWDRQSAAGPGTGSGPARACGTDKAPAGTDGANEAPAAAGETDKAPAGADGANEAPMRVCGTAKTQAGAVGANEAPARAGETVKETAGASNHRTVGDPHHPAVLRLLEMTVANARTAGIPVGICGGLAADRTMTDYFLSIGVGELSVPPRDIPVLRGLIRAL